MSGPDNFSFSKTIDPFDIPPKKPPIEKSATFSYSPVKRLRYSCTKCSSKFETKFLLNLHRVTRCPKLPYACDSCELRFSSISNFKSHQKVHTQVQNVEHEIMNKTNVKGLKKKGPSRTSFKKNQSVQFKQPKAENAFVLNVKKNQETLGNYSIKVATMNKTNFEEAGIVKTRKQRFKSSTQRKQPIESRATKSQKMDMDKLKLEDPAGTNAQKQKTNEKLQVDNSAGSGDQKGYDGFQAKEEDTLFSSDCDSSTIKEIVPSTCKTCRMTFIGKKKLERHMRIHSAKKAYKCERCHLAFYWKSNFNRHQKIECTVENSHQCDKCHRFFSRKFDLLRHYQTHHERKDAEKDDSEKDEPCDEGTDVNSEKETEGDVMDKTEDESEKDVEDERKGADSEMNQDRYKFEQRSLSEIEYSGNQLDGDDVDQEPDTSSNRRNKMRYVQRRYKCDVCNIRFKWKCDLNRHRITHSNNKAYPCELCDLSFNWKSNLTRHQRTVHLGEATYHCDQCGFSFVKSYQLQRHVNSYCKRNRTNRNKRLKSEGGDNCEEPPTLKIEDTLEVKTFANEVVKEEPDSSTQTTSEETRPDPDQQVNIVYLHVCQKGGEHSHEKSNEIMQPMPSPLHASTSAPAPVAKKEFTDIPIKTEVDALIQEDTAGPQKEWVCSKCSRIFFRKTCYVQHERSHERQPIKCLWCGREFLRRSMFEKHELVHKGDKPFKCECCPAYFKLQSQLMTHMKLHSGEKPFQCDYCECRFSRMSLLDRHRMTHTGERPHKCEFCGLSFIQKCSLVLHQKVHVGENPYKCAKCKIRFAEKSSYQRHLDRVHAGESIESFHRPRHHKIMGSSVDQHFYNTRFAQKSQDVESNEEVDDPGPRKKIKQEVEVECLVTSSSLRPKSKPRNRKPARSHESRPSGSRRKRRKTNRICTEEVEEMSDYCEVIEEKVSNLQSFDENVSDRRVSDNVRSRTRRMTIRNLAPRKDINSYKSESINEFLKSYKSKSVFKEKGVRTKGEMSTIREAMKALRHSEAANTATVENIRCKDNRNRSRRCSEEMEISKGLENFHIGSCKNTVPCVKDSGGNSLEENASIVQSAAGETSVEHRIFLESNSNVSSYKTLQGICIFQDIISVESPSHSLNIKSEDKIDDMEMSERNKDQECVQKGGNPVLMNAKKDVNFVDDVNALKPEKIGENPEYKTGIHPENDYKIGELQKYGNMTDQESKKIAVGSVAKIREGLNGKCTEAVNIIRVRECLSNLNTDKNTGLKESVDCQKSEVSRGNSRAINCNYVSTQNQYEESSFPNYTIESIVKCGVDKDNGQKTISTHEIAEGNQDNKSENTTHENSLLVDYFEGSTTLSTEKDLVGGEALDGQYVEGVTQKDEYVLGIPHVEAQLYQHRPAIIQVLKKDEMHSERTNVTKEIERPFYRSKDETLDSYHTIERDISDILCMQKDPNFELSNELNSDKLNDNSEVHATTQNIKDTHEVNSNCSSKTPDDEFNSINEMPHGISNCTPESTSESLDKSHNNKLDCVQSIPNFGSNTLPEVHSIEHNQQIPNGVIEEMQTKETSLHLEVPSDRELLPVNTPYNRTRDQLFKKRIGRDLNDCEETQLIPKIDFQMDVATDSNLSLHDNQTAEARFLKKPGWCEEMDMLQQFTHFHAKQAPHSRHDQQSVQFKSVSPSLVDKENTSDQNCKDAYANNKMTALKESFEAYPISRSQNSPVSLQNVYTENNTHQIHPEIQANQVFNIDKTSELNPARHFIEQNYESNPNVLQSIQFIYKTHNDNDLSIPYETRNENFQDKGVKFEQCPPYQNFEIGSKKNGVIVNNGRFDESFYNKDKAFQDQNVQPHAGNEIACNYQVEGSTYNTDIDEETIRYAVQTVQAIIQSEVPMSRDSIQSVQVPIQYHDQEFVRYETQSFHVPVQFGSSFHNGYGVQSSEHQLPHFESFRKENTQREIVQYDIPNIEMPPRYSYIENDNVHLQTLMHSRNGFDHEKLVLKGHCSTKYPAPHTSTFKQNSILYEGAHEAIGFEEVLPSSKHLSNLVPFQNNRNLERVSYEKASSIPNELHDNVQLAPYESVKVSETVYTNLELASYGKSTDVTYVPYKELFFNNSVINKGQMEQNVLYSDMYPYTTTSEKLYSFPFRPQPMRLNEAQPSQVSIDYEQSYSYPTYHVKNMQDCLPHTVTNDSEALIYKEHIPNNSKKEMRSSSVLGQYSRGQKNVRKNRSRPEDSNPKKSRVLIRPRRIDLSNPERQSIDFVRHQGEQWNRRRSSCDQVTQKNVDFDQNGAKMYEFNPDMNNPNKRIRIVPYDNSSDYIEQETQIYAKEMSNSEKSFDCDQCNRIFNRKNDLIRHRFTEHEKNRPSSSFQNNYTEL